MFPDAIQRDREREKVGQLPAFLIHTDVSHYHHAFLAMTGWTLKLWTKVNLPFPKSPLVTSPKSPLVTYEVRTMRKVVDTTQMSLDN